MLIGTSNKQICDLKQRLVYMELSTIKALLKIFTQHSLISEPDSLTPYKEAMVYYRNYDQSKDEKSQDYSTINLEFENYLTKLYKIRSTLWSQLEAICKHQKEPWQNELSLLDKLDLQLDTIIHHINLDLVLPNNIRSNYEKSLDLLVTALQQKPILFAPKILHLITLLEIYKKWNALLKKQLNDIKTKKTKNLKTVLAIKKLLYNKKLSLLKHWLQEITNSKDQLNQLLTKQLLLAPQNLINDLERQLNNIRKDVAQNEKDLLSLCGWRYVIPSTLIRILTGNVYYEISELAFATIQETLETPSFVDVPLAHIKLTDPYQQFFKSMTASLILAWELSGMTQIGFPFFLLQTLSHWISRDFNSWNRIFHALGKDEFSLITSQEKLQLGIGFGTITGLEIIRLWWQNLEMSWTIIGLNNGWYLAAVIVQKSLSRLITWLLGDNYTLLPAVKPLIEYTGYSLGSAGFAKALDLLLPGGFFQSANVDDLLKNNDLCQRHQEECRQAAYKTLGFNQPASSSDVEKTCRKLALAYHPDKNTLDVDKFVKINQVCNVLKKPIP